MTRVRQHIPGYVTGLQPEIANAHSHSELLNLPFVFVWTRDPQFDHWERATDYSPDEWLLVAKMKDGRHWVAAYVGMDLKSPLPEFQMHRASVDITV